MPLLKSILFICFDEYSTVLEFWTSETSLRIE